MSTLSRAAETALITLGWLSTPLNWQMLAKGDVVCVKFSDTTQTCPACPGFQPCLCVAYYGSYICPGDDIICNTRHGLETGSCIVAEVSTHCYTSRGCSAPPGGCIPYYAPCRKDDAIGNVGTWYTYTVVGIGCANP